MPLSSSAKAWLFRLLIGLLVVMLLGTAIMVYKMRSYGFWRSPVYEIDAPQVPDLKRPAVLVFSKTNSFIHKEAIPAAEELLQQLGNKNGWSVYVTENGAVHNLQDLARFDAIVWNNVTGDVLTPEQRSAMRQWLENGGGWVGLHGAGDSSSDWDWYIDSLVGARFTAHPFPEQFQQATLQPESADPIVAHLPRPWQRTDEWYSFAASPRGKGFTVLTTLDETTYNPDFRGQDLRMGDDHPVIWKHCVQRGRALYSALGHTAESYREPAYTQLLEAGVSWAAGLGDRGCQQVPESPAPNPLRPQVPVPK
ncbi:ThuA domain-containing protein [Aestuariicella hydrocarbonica]|uniref:ThuA domain-containing protein n=1 Tax=Pseudomaricurvus hydrocarbonicus TaxID=1470433 RepID=A0A9E5JSB1_9GAMM|nr:ThuA domain-containing protein [Aestuariicella hydrocarbonica]NHO65639.1 ThuA domain-containing protein [Aestuariicella hydrocarbonica]